MIDDSVTSSNANGEDIGKEKEKVDPKDGGSSSVASKKARNNLREIRIDNMMSKAELARKAGLSVLTITRIENGYGCRMDTKRKILKALGLKVADRRKVFEDD